MSADDQEHNAQGQDYKHPAKPTFPFAHLSDPVEVVLPGLPVMVGRILDVEVVGRRGDHAVDGAWLLGLHPLDAV